MVENANASNEMLLRAVPTAEEWVKMWDSGFTHDYGQHETTYAASPSGESHSHHHHHHHHGDDGSDSDPYPVDKYLKQYLHKLTADDTSKTVLVSLCGNSPDMVWLCHKGYKVVGMEISEAAVKSVFEKAVGGPIPFKVAIDGDIKIYSATDDKDLKIVVGNFFNDEINADKFGKFDCIWDSHGIISLPKEQQKLYAEKLGSFMKPDGKILFTTVDYNITKLTDGPSPSPVGFHVLQKFYPQCKVELLESKAFTSEQLEAIREWNNRASTCAKGHSPVACTLLVSY